ncbi:MAG: bifunctional folylpolyglutamate synthase/dihydrofolate synthase [Dehalococcoidia bacterium]
MINNNFEKTLSKVFSLADFERKENSVKYKDFHLLKVRRFLDYIGNPHINQNFIHVAGSKGKGSTAKIISSCLSENNIKTGLFISPSIHRFTERISISGKNILKKEFIDLVEDLWPYVTKINKEKDLGTITVFEFLTVMSFEYFNRQKTNINVIEVGLGGRYDSTNVISPMISVITPISLDHMNVLGKTISKIAYQKAGIIKNKIPVVITKQNITAKKIISDIAIKKESKIYESNKEIKIIKKEDKGLSGVKLNLHNNILNKSHQTYLKLLGDHQIDNLKTALTTLSIIKKNGVKIDLDKSCEKIMDITWPGRNNFISKNPNIFVDGAHNDDSAKLLSKNINNFFPKLNNLIIIFGCNIGHEPKDIIEKFSNYNPKIIITQSRHPKSFDLKNMKNLLVNSKIKILSYTKNTNQALIEAKKQAKTNDLILATGSLFIAAEIIEIVEKIKPEVYEI